MTISGGENWSSLTWAERNGCPEVDAKLDHQHRSLVVWGIVSCSLLFVNIRVWPEDAQFPQHPAATNRRESRLTTKKDAIGMHVKRLASGKPALSAPRFAHFDEVTVGIADVSADLSAVILWLREELGAHG